MKNINLKIIKLLFILIATLIFNACKPEEMVQKSTECTAANTVKFPQDALDRFYFKNGTYWVYQDSATSSLDSAWVVNSRLETRVPDGYGGDICYDYYLYRLVTSYFKDSFLVNLLPNGVIDNIKDTNDLDYKIHYYFLNYNYPIYRLYFNNKTIKNSNQEGGIITTNKTILSANVQYTNCVELFYINNGTDIYKYAYYAKNIGLVKYQLKNGSVWQLIRYNIIQ